MSRILIFIPCFTHGGAEKQGILLARALHKRGFEVSVWAFPPLHPPLMRLDTSALEREGIRCYEFPDWPHIQYLFFEKPFRWHRILEYYRGWCRPVQRLRDQAPKEVFDAVIPFTTPACLAAVLLKDQLQARVLFWNHRGGASDGMVYPEYIKRLILGANPVYMANSTGGVQFLRAVFDQPESRVHIIHNAFIADGEVHAIRGHYGGAKDVFALLQVANFFPEKDWETLLAGMAILKQRRIRACLRLVGAFIDASEQQRFEHRVEALDVRDVVVCCGAMRKEDIAVRFGPTIHAGVLSSLSEGMPNAIMEYMYWGLPVIGTDIPGIRDLLGGHHMPRLFKPGDASGFADAVAHLAANPDQLHMLGDRNRRRLEEHFSEEKIMPRWVERIRKSLDQAG